VSRALVDSVATRIESVVGAARTVYRGEVPDSPSARYLVVRSNIGTDESVDLGDSQTLRSATVWVTSVSRNDNPVTAHDEAVWGAEKAHDALKGWRPTIGRAAWKPVSLSSSEPTRDDSLPDTVYSTFERWGFQFQP
jgi:hypothetical protein